MFYKALGFIVWKGAKWYVRRKGPSRHALVGSVLGLGFATAVAAGAARDSD